MSLRYYDIHAHLADARIRSELPDMLAASRQHGVAGILANAARLHEWPRLLDLCREPGIHGALGLHPFFVDEWHAGVPGELRRLLAAHPELRAIGEIGLDFQDGRDSEARQREAFVAQLAVACDMHRPVIMHNRKSWNEFFALWRESGAARAGITGVCHHFSASPEVARQALDLGLYLSFCGPLTYPNATRLKAVAAYVPLDRLLTETDCPDLPAAAYRGGWSVPWQVQAIVTEIARLKQVSKETVATAVEQNYRRVLGLSAEPLDPVRNRPETARNGQNTDGSGARRSPETRDSRLMEGEPKTKSLSLAEGALSRVDRQLASRSVHCPVTPLPVTLPVPLPVPDPAPTRHPEAAPQP